MSIHTCAKYMWAILKLLCYLLDIVAILSRNIWIVIGNWGAKLRTTNNKLSSSHSYYNSIIHNIIVFCLWGTRIFASINILCSIKVTTIILPIFLFYSEVVLVYNYVHNLHISICKVNAHTLISISISTSHPVHVLILLHF